MVFKNYAVLRFTRYFQEKYCSSDTLYLHGDFSRLYTYNPLDVVNINSIFQYQKVVLLVSKMGAENDPKIVNNVLSSVQNNENLDFYVKKTHMLPSRKLYSKVQQTLKT